MNEFFNNNTADYEKKEIIYNDRFFIGDSEEVDYFRATLIEYYNAMTLSIELGDVVGGYNCCIDIRSETDLAGTIVEIRKISEGFQNLLTVLESQLQVKRK